MINHFYRIPEDQTLLNSAYLRGNNFEPWSNDFRFCACSQTNTIQDNNIACGANHTNTNLQKSCTEERMEADRVKCDFGRRKRATDMHTSKATRKLLHAVKVNKVNNFVLLDI